MRNPLLNTIKQSLPLNFEIALMATSKVFDEPPFMLDEDNVGYIALHIGAAIERRSKGQSAALGALVVCQLWRRGGLLAQGPARDALRKARSGWWPRSPTRTTSSCRRTSLRTWRSSSPTVPLKDCPAPTVLVDFSLPAADVKSVSRLVQYLEDDNFDKVRRFFSPGAFRVVEDELTKEELLRDMCAQLVSEGARRRGGSSRPRWSGRPWRTPA